MSSASARVLKVTSYMRASITLLGGQKGKACKVAGSRGYAPLYDG